MSRSPAKLGFGHHLHSAAPKSSSPLNCSNNGLLQPLLHANFLSDKPSRSSSLSHSSLKSSAHSGDINDDGLMQTPHIPSVLPINPPPAPTSLFFLFPPSFLPYLTSIPHFPSCYSAAPVQALFTRSLLKSRKKAQQQLATLFSKAGIEELGALCMSEPHSSSSIQTPALASTIHQDPTLLRAREQREKKRRHQPFLSLYSTWLYKHFQSPH